MQKYSLDSLGEFLVEMLPGFPEAGCPERMKVKEVKAVDYATFALLAAWDNSITVMENSLNFFQMLVEKLIAKEDELQISGYHESLLMCVIARNGSANLTCRSLKEVQAENTKQQRVSTPKYVERLALADMAQAMSLPPQRL
ncbi:unnamed protein product [Cladocopium goreaui]|uniref:Uncharacterized protein n=1 Tax=Cladocopium goreaui TaxID=2562237 RepID=A0A9P1M3S6_9DINO|nr:unnamed protein product [Cladocopium goreaui]